MANTIKLRRGLKPGLTTIQGLGQLTQGEPYLITGETLSINNDEARLAVGLDATNYMILARQDKTQPLDADLTAIADISATTGLLKKDSTGNWSLDTNPYITAETDTLQTVIGRGATATSAATFEAGLTVNKIGSTTGVTFVGNTSGTTKIVANAATGGTNTLTLPTGSGTLAKLTDIPTPGNGELTLSISGAANSGSAIGVGTSTGFTANTASASAYTITVGPALSDLATTMATGTLGLLRKDAIDSYIIDTTAYTTTATTLDAFADPVAAIEMGNNKITGLATPTDAADAANKSYVDSVAQGLDIKASVRLATATNITLSGAQSIDGIAVALNDRILVKNQTDPNQNGIYIANTGGAWTRSADANDWNELISAFTFVEQGTLYADTSWVCTINAGQTLGSAPVIFVQFGAASTIQDGAGLLYDGNTLNVGAGTGITVNANTVQISDTYAGQNSIQTVGNGATPVTTGVWNATAIGAVYGGTGLTSYATGDILYANGTNTLTKLTKPASLDSFLQMNSAGTPSWVSTIDGGTF